MKVELIDLTEDNMKQCFELKVASNQMQYIASNEDSWKAAKENEKVARPFAIYCDEKIVGFTMFAFDEEYEDPNDRYWLWRFMIDENLQGNGYGTAALQVIIQYFREHGANNIRLSTKETNTTALSMYRKAGFRDTGEMNDEELCFNCICKFQFDEGALFCEEINIFNPYNILFAWFALMFTKRAISG